LPDQQPTSQANHREWLAIEHRDLHLRQQDERTNERGSLTRMRPREHFEARQPARERAGAGLPSGPRLLLPPRLMLADALATLRHQTRDIRRDAAYMLGRLLYEPVVTGLDDLPAQRPYITLSNHYERRPGTWVGWGGCIIIDAIARANPGEYPIREVMTSNWEDFHIDSWFLVRRSPASALGVAAFCRSLRHNPDTGR
jgi:hypothetical protein